MSLCLGPRRVLGGWACSDERGTPVLRSLDSVYAATGEEYVLKRYAMISLESATFSPCSKLWGLRCRVSGCRGYGRHYSVAFKVRRMQQSCSIPQHRFQSSHYGWSSQKLKDLPLDEFNGFVDPRLWSVTRVSLPRILESYVTKFAPHKALLFFA